MLEREQYLHDSERDGDVTGTAIRVVVAYIDGFGRPIQTKRLVDPGPAIARDVNGAVIVDADGTAILADAAHRWLVSGFEAYNNKGWAVRKYEPFFSPRPEFEADASIRRYGVATRHIYDAAGRTIRREFPNGTIATTAYTPWELREADATDTVAGSACEAARLALPANNPERQALVQAQAHAGTPTIVELDVLGRSARVRELGGGGEERVTRTELNDAGHIRLADAADALAKRFGARETPPSLWLGAGVIGDPLGDCLVAPPERTRAGTTVR